MLRKNLNKTHMILLVEKNAKVQEAKSDYSDYMKRLETETDIEKIDIDTLREKGMAK